jgi:hypothetical protein
LTVRSQVPADPAKYTVPNRFGGVLRAAVVARSVVKVLLVLANGAAKRPATAMRDGAYREFAEQNSRYCRWAAVVKVTTKYICGRLEDDAVGPLT